MSRVRGSYVAVLITCASMEEAERLAKSLLEAKLAACINIARGVKSLFWWEGRVEEAEEALMIVKTRLDRLSELVKEVKARHSYTVPEVVALPIVAGLEDYLKWLDEAVPPAHEPSGMQALRQ